MIVRDRHDRCPTLEELSMGLSAGDTHAAHAAECKRCSRELAALRRVIALARAIPAPPDRSDVEEQRAQLLALSERPSRPTRVRRVPVALAVPLVAAAAFAILALPRRADETQPATPESIPALAPSPVAPLPPPPAPTRRAAISASNGASYALVTPQPDEVVQLHDGTLRVQVAHLDPGERFRIITGNAEVEVRGTSFEVVVEADRLMSVGVDAGRVDVRPRDGKPFTLLAGQRWNDRVARTGRKTASAAASHQTDGPVSTVAVAHPPGSASATELAFQRGVAALQAGSISLAITELERVVADPDCPLIEDGRFWIAVAYARAKRARAAVEAFERFLDHHPRSVRHGEATTMLAWQLLDLGEHDRARALFEQGLADPNPAVRRSARAGLEMITARD